MSTIRKQNSNESIKMLAAQRAIYSHAKKWWGFLLIINLVFVPAISILAIQNTSVASYAAIASIAILILNGLGWLVIRQHVRQAAEIQELFDIKVLNIPKNELLFEMNDLDELIESWSTVYFKSRDDKKLVDWYAPKLKSMPQLKATFTGQRINSWWDKSLRTVYTTAILVIAVIVASGLVYFGLIRDLSLKDFTLSVLVPFVPLFQLVVAEAFKNYAAGSNANKNLKHAVDLIESEKNGRAEIIDARTMQDAIFQHRISAPLIFDFVYTISRKQKELTMRRSNK